LHYYGASLLSPSAGERPGNLVGTFDTRLIPISLDSRHILSSATSGFTGIKVGAPNRSISVIELKKIEEIVESITRVLPTGTNQVTKEIRENVRIALEAGFVRMNLVTREEFDAQMLVLQRTREKLDALEKIVASLEGTVE
jgi:BMFP domain-containing protein YqiC